MLWKSCSKTSCMSLPGVSCWQVWRWSEPLEHFRIFSGHYTSCIDASNMTNADLPRQICCCICSCVLTTESWWIRTCTGNCRYNIDQHRIWYIYAYDVSYCTVIVHNIMISCRSKSPLPAHGRIRHARPCPQNNYSSWHVFCCAGLNFKPLPHCPTRTKRIHCTPKPQGASRPAQPQLRPSKYLEAWTFGWLRIIAAFFLEANESKDITSIFKGSDWSSISG